MPATARYPRERRPIDDMWLGRWGRHVHRHRGLVLTGSLVAMLGVGMLFAFAGEYHISGTPLDTTESGHAALLIQEEVPGAATPTFMLILTHATADWQDAAFRDAAADALAPLAEDPQVTRVFSAYDVPPQQATALVSEDGRSILAVVSMAGGYVDALDHYPAARESVESDVLEITSTGNLALGETFTRIFEEDMPRTEAVSMPLTLIVLLIVFGAVVAALIPLAIGAMVIVGGLALTGFLANFVTLPDWATQIVSLLGLGVAIDYSLFIVNRFREELAGGVDREKALGRALATSGHAILFSGLTVAVSLGGLVFFHGLEFAGNGYAIAAAVALAVFLAMTFLPALLAFLGPRISKLRIGRRRPKSADNGVWHRIAGAVMHRPVLYLVAVLLIVGVLATPVFSMRLAGVSIDQIPEDEEARQGFEFLAAEFPRQGESSLQVVLDWDEGSPISRDRIGALYDLDRAVAAIPHVVAVSSLANIDASFDKADYQDTYDKPRGEWPIAAQRLADTQVGESIIVLDVAMDVASQSETARDVVKGIRALSDPAGGSVLVTGLSASDVDNIQIVGERAPYAIAFVILATFVLLVFQVRSLVLPAKAIVMNVLSVSASFGVIVALFQWGWAADILDFTPTAMEPGNLILMFCIVFGLSMDYEVLLLSRMHEEYLKSGDNRHAVQMGLEKSGRIITGAALIMVFVFGAFGVIRITFMKVIGVGLAFAILFDATIIRAFLVPSAMRLMGRWNWWAPDWLRPPQPHAPVPAPVPARTPTPAAPALARRPARVQIFTADDLRSRDKAVMRHEAPPPSAAARGSQPKTLATPRPAAMEPYRANDPRERNGSG